MEQSIQPRAGASGFIARNTRTPRAAARARKLSTSARGSASSESSTTAAPHSAAACSTAWPLQNSASE
ncbi:MAG: hypothetical protein V8S24_05135 [Gordonibacter pamelaeae]